MKQIITTCLVIIGLSYYIMYQYFIQFLSLLIIINIISYC